MDTVSHIYDTYEDYKILCKKYQEKQLPLEKDSNWLGHFRELELIERRENE
jgi:hypothetical protein